METKTPIRLTLAMVMAMTVLGVTARSAITYQATYHQSQATLGTDTLGGVTYSTVSYQGLYNDGAPGAPSLPVDYIKFSVPYNATNFSVSTTVSSSFTLYPEILYPCQPIRLMNDTTPLIITLPDSTIYYSNTYYPSQRAWVVDEGYLAGENHIVTVAVLPWQYKHLTRVGSVDQLKLHRTVNLTLSYDLSDSLAMYPIVRDDTTLRNEGYRLTQEIVVNGGSVRSHAPVDIAMMDPDALIFPPGDGVNGGFPPQEPRDSTGMIPDPGNTGNYGGEEDVDSYPYLIVTTSDLLQSTKRLAALKRQKGYNVKVVTMDEVLSSPHAMDGDRIKQSDGTYKVTYTDAAGKLRQYLRYFYREYSTQYVFLVGDSVPYRYITLPRWEGDTTLSTPPSDLYYCDLNADWSEDTIDTEPELYVGRIFAKNSRSTLNYTDKLLRYELNPGRGDTEYLSKLFYAEAIDFEKHGDFNTINTSYMKLFSDTTRLLETINMRYPTGKDVIDSLNSTNYGYLSILCHGAPSNYITYGHRRYYPKDTLGVKQHYYLWAIDSIHITNYNNNNTEDTLIGNGFNNMNNKWHPNICYSSGCTTMPYDRIPGFKKVSTTIGDSFTTGKDYGGPAFLGNTREGLFINNSSKLESLFAEQLYQGRCNTGKAEALSKMNMNNDYISATHNLLGEPEFEIWTDVPANLTDISIARTDNSITISGVEADSIIIGYSNMMGYYGHKTINSPNGTISNVSSNRPIMIYKHNHIPYIVPLWLQNTTLNSSQYVFASDVVAGHSIDSGRTSGDVTVQNGVEYEIEASGTVTLQGGFNVEKGATFAVYPSSF